LIELVEQNRFTFGFKRLTACAIFKLRYYMNLDVANSKCFEAVKYFFEKICFNRVKEKKID